MKASVILLTLFLLIRNSPSFANNFFLKYTQPITTIDMKKQLLYFSFFLFMLFGVVQVNGQSIASFTTGPTNPLICNPITVSTTVTLWCINNTLLPSSNTVVGSIIYVNVNVNAPAICLPAIGSATQTHTLTNIPSAGTYRLTVRCFTNGTQTDTSSTTIVIGSCCSVNTNFAASTTAICPGDSITFTSSNSALMNYGWKIDGSPVQAGITMGQRFQTAGTYNITLVGNDTTCIDSTQKTIQVVTYPIIGFQSPVNENCPGSMDGMVNTSVSGGIGAYAYNWSTGDTLPGISQVSGGTYTVTVTDSLGCASTDTITLTTGPAIIASFIPGKTTQICPGETINFTNSGANGSSFIWKKDGQQFSQSTNAFYTFNDTGSFTISLYAEDGPACADSFSMNFTVSGPTADFTSSALTRACPDEVIMLTNSSLAANNYTWQSGGSTFAISNDATISFSQQNSYDITLIASDGFCADTTAISVNVTAPSASFSASKMSPICPGEFAILTNTSTNNIGNWWSANGMQFSMNGNAVYTFNDPGMTDIKLVIKDDRCFDSTSMSFSVNALPTVMSDVQDETCEGDNDGSISLTVSGGVAPFVYSWSNGSTTKNLSNLTAGTFDVIVRDTDGCEWTDSYVIKTKGGVTARYSTQQTSSGIQFTDLSDTTATSWTWDFGDGNSSTSQSPLHNYAFNGKYIICLTARDRFGCTDMTCDTLDVTTSIWENQAEALAFYPNPTQEAIYLNLSSLQGKPVVIRLHDQMGREVKMESLIASADLKIDLSHLPKAVYILSVASKDRRLVAKVIKN